MSKGFLNFFGEKQIQSKSPVKGWVPDVSIWIFLSSFLRAFVRSDKSCIRGSPPVITTNSAEVFNTLFTEKSPIAPKEARLAAIAVSAAIKCEYCVSAQVHLAKQAGANDEEIKAAIQIAAEIQRFSTLLYGNEFGIEKLEKIIGKESK